MSICMYFTDTLHPMDITMSRVCLASDTCDLYFSYIKVNRLLYTCSLDPFEDGILLDTLLVCMHRYCRSFTDDEEECKLYHLIEAKVSRLSMRWWLSFWRKSTLTIRLRTCV